MSPSEVDRDSVRHRTTEKATCAHATRKREKLRETSKATTTPEQLAIFVAAQKSSGPAARKCYGELRSSRSKSPERAILKQLEQAALHQKVPPPQLFHFLGKGCATQGVS